MIKLFLWASVMMGIYCLPSPYQTVYSTLPIDEKLLALYQKEGVLFPEIVILQNRLETGNFTSKISVQNLNMWGMKNNKHGFSTGKVNGHACYKNIEDGVKDYKRWQVQMFKSHNKSYPDNNISETSTEIEYLWFLDHLFLIEGKNMRYAEDTLYVQKLLLLKKKQESMLDVQGNLEK